MKIKINLSTATADELTSVIAFLEAMLTKKANGEDSHSMQENDESETEIPKPVKVKPAKLKAVKKEQEVEETEDETPEPAKAKPKRKAAKKKVTKTAPPEVKETKNGKNEEDVTADDLREKMAAILKAKKEESSEAWSSAKAKMRYKMAELDTTSVTLMDKKHYAEFMTFLNDLA